jgi:hypothetical protein
MRERRRLAAGRRPDSMNSMFALPAVFAVVPGLRRCGCCGGVYTLRRVRELAATPGVFICRDCARSAASRTARRRRR